MPDKILAGYRTLGAWTPIQLYSGERPIVTSQAVAAAGNTFGQLNERDETYRFEIVARNAAGKVVPWNPAAARVAVAGGAAGQTEAAPEARIYGILPHAMDTTAAGYNADTPTPVILDAVINPEAMRQFAVAADAAAKAAMLESMRASLQYPGTNITFTKLY